MFKTIVNAFKTPDVRKRILYKNVYKKLEILFT